jgi:hypothetical protein
MTAARATWRDIPVIAWTMSCAYTRKKGKDRPLHAALAYPVYAAITAGLTAQGTLYHRNRHTIAAAIPHGTSPLRPAAAMTGTILLVYTTGIAIASLLQLGPIAGYTIALLLLLPGITSLTRTNLTKPQRTAEKTLKDYSKTRKITVISNVARSLSDPPGSGTRLMLELAAEAARKGYVPACTAANPKLQFIYERDGFVSIQGSLAMYYAGR